MTPAPAPGLQRLLEALDEMAAEEGLAVALVGGWARSIWGGVADVATVEVVGSGVPVEREATWTSRGPDTLDWLPRLRWSVREDEFAPLYEHALATAVRVPRWPMRVATMELLGAMLLAERTEQAAEQLIADVAAGAHDTKRLRAVCLQWLGPYAISDVERLIEEAEWRAMTQKYKGGAPVH